MFLSHQLELGSFLGAWLGGYAYDVFGFYDLVWIAAVFLHWPIFEPRFSSLRCGGTMGINSNRSQETVVCKLEGR